MELVVMHDSKSCVARRGSSTLPSGTKKMKSKILVILGQTATGKTGLGVKLAKKWKGEVISADSRQVYKGLDLGTHKITKQEMRGVPHHLLDVASPKKNFSVVQFKKLAEKKITEILKRKKLPIIVGGTGFYIQAIVDNVDFPEHKPDLKLRAKLEKKNTEQLFKILKKLDPKRAKNIDQKNPRRLMRAIEIAKALGHVPRLDTPRPSQYDALQIGLTPHPEILKTKIKYRFIKDLDNIINEVKKLRNPPAGGGLSWKRLKELGLYYREVALYLEGKIKKEEMIQKIFSVLWQYAKRQKTWFKRDSRIHWFDPSKKSDLIKLNKQVLVFLKQRNHRG